MNASALVSTIGGDFGVRSCMSVSLIRCLESELYAAIVALSIIPVEPICWTCFDVPATATCSRKHQPARSQEDPELAHKCSARSRAPHITQPPIRDAAHQGRKLAPR